MKTYDITGNQISQEISIYNSYDITLIGNEHVYIHSSMNQINIIDCLTENKHITICNEFGFKITIFRKHIVKITEVNKMSKDIKKWSYETEIKYLDSENKELKQRISNLVSQNTKLQNDLFSEQLEQDETEDYIEELKDELKEANSDVGIFIAENEELKEDNKILIEIKNIWLDSHRLVTQERDKLEKELKEYRGF